MKLHTTVSPYGNIKDDLFYWIKLHISQKLFDIKQDDGYDVDIIEVSQKLFKSENLEVFNKEQLKIAKNGFFSINVYVNPLLNLYDFVSKEESLKKITDFDTVYRDKIFQGTIKNFKYNTKMLHFARINDLFFFIENFLSNIKDAEKYTFNIENKIVNNKIIYPFLKDNTLKKVIEEDEIIQLISMMDSFPYRGMSSAKAKLMLKFVLFGSLSGSELSRLKKENIKIVKNPNYLLRGTYLSLHVKHPKERTVYINEKLITQEYEQYELEYKAFHFSQHTKLYFYTQDGKRYTSASLYYQFEMVIKYTNIDIENSANSFLKYGYATYLFRNNVSLEIILTLFGDKQEICRQLERGSPKITRDEMREIAKEWKDF